MMTAQVPLRTYKFLFFFFFFNHFENGTTCGKFVVHTVCVCFTVHTVCISFCYAQIRLELPYVPTNIQIVLLRDAHTNTSDVNPCSILTKLGCVDKILLKHPNIKFQVASLYTRKDELGDFN
jgi:hypothetical protein